MHSIGCFFSVANYTEVLNEVGQRVKKPASPGQYKRLSNHVIQPDGTIHRYTEPLNVVDELEYLVNRTANLKNVWPTFCAVQ